MLFLKWEFIERRIKGREEGKRNAERGRIGKEQPASSEEQWKKKAKTHVFVRYLDLFGLTAWMHTVALAG